MRGVKALTAGCRIPKLENLKHRLFEVIRGQIEEIAEGSEGDKEGLVRRERHTRIIGHLARAVDTLARIEQRILSTAKGASGRDEFTHEEIKRLRTDLAKRIEQIAKGPSELEPRDRPAG